MCTMMCMVIDRCGADSIPIGMLDLKKTFYAYRAVDDCGHLMCFMSANLLYVMP